MALKITSATFSACVVGKDNLPEDQLPIVALVGRSNVGKSSLINCITGRKELAKTSSLPGKTLTINFYCINDAFYIVDLPGYGYAKASKVTKQRIQAMMNEFFVECKNLKGVIQVIDIRHKPSPLDVQMNSWIKDQKLNFISVLTKADKLGHQQVQKMRGQILKDLRMNFALVFSSKNQTGKEEFIDALEKIVAGFEFKTSETRKPRPGKNASAAPRKPGDRKKKPDANARDLSNEKDQKQKTNTDENKEKPEGASQSDGVKKPARRRRRWKSNKKPGSETKKPDSPAD